MSVTTDADVRRSHSADVSGLVMVPDAVARPASTDDVRELLRQATADRTPVTTAGSQTSTTGASITDCGILLSMRGMNRIVDVDVAGRRAVVEPGVLLGDLNRMLAPHGLHFAPDPTSLDDVTVGGAIACNASGARSLLYGPTRPHVAALQVVLATGDVADVRRSGLEKNTVGYAFAQEPVDWFVGSEGTLGVITLAELSLLPLPASVVGLAIPCPDEGAALRLVEAIRVAPKLAPRCIEYFDATSVAIAREHGGAPWADGALLYVEDTSGDLDPWLAIAEQHGALVADVGVFDGESALRDARRFRHAVPATMNERGSGRRVHGGRKVSTDWAVPYHKLAVAIAEARRLVDAAGLAQPAIYGHAGNGHPHENFVAQDAADLEAIELVVEATLKHVLSLGGTVSAEHGIGKIKRRWLPLQATPLQIAVMRAVKRELDPGGLLAPGNIL
ncbi:MAG: FAD-binding oxidoreductase [Gemmatimonadaceae bacterium]